MAYSVIFRNMAWCERNDENVAKDHFLDENKDTSDGKPVFIQHGLMNFWRNFHQSNYAYIWIVGFVVL